jgi:hypothetical protein
MRWIKKKNLTKIYRTRPKQGMWRVFEFFGGTSGFQYLFNIFFPVNAILIPIAYVIQ